MNSRNNDDYIYQYEHIDDGAESAHGKRKGTVIAGITALIFCLIIFGVSLLHLLVPDQSFSESENRVLSLMPKFSLSAVADGSFMEDFETYLTDQFPFRDSLISLKTYADRLLGKSKENGVYIGKDGFLFDSPTVYREGQGKSITDAIRAFQEKNSRLNVTVAIAPNSSYIYSDKLPAYWQPDDQRDYLRKIYILLKGSGVNWIDASKVLAEKAKSSDQLLYYKTDHHWTTAGAYTVFESILEQWKMTTYTKGYAFYTVADDFRGTMASASGVNDVGDRVEICVPKDSEGTYVVEFESKGEKTSSLFFSDRLKNKNKYEVFLGGNYDKVNITTVSPSKNSLLIIKDSYANCMIPMLTPYFNKIVVIDPRYLTDSLDSIIKENSFTHVLFLYNLNTLLEDSSLAECLAG